MNEVITA
jgi:chromosome segregation ATPase